MRFLSIQLILLQGVDLGHLEYLEQSRMKTRPLGPICRQGNFRVGFGRLLLPGQDELLPTGTSRAPLAERHHNGENQTPVVLLVER